MGHLCSRLPIMALGLCMHHSMHSGYIQYIGVRVQNVEPASGTYRLEVKRVTTPACCGGLAH